MISVKILGIGVHGFYVYYITLLSYIVRLLFGLRTLRPCIMVLK